MNKENLKQDFIRIFENKEIESLLITNDMGKFGLLEGCDKLETNKEIFECIKSVIPNATIIVPTANLNLPNSKKTYDNDETPSYKMGSFSEYVRKHAESLRSFHPFWSLSAIGDKSQFLTSNISNHAYAKNSVFSKIFSNSKNYFLSIGNHPKFMLPVIHHLEHINNVPYRFEKKFKIFCRKSSFFEFEEMEFKLDVLKDEFRNRKRGYNNLIFENFEKKGTLIFNNPKNPKMYLFNLLEFYEITNLLFNKNINCWWE